MTNILSQDEVDSLLEGISDGKIETENSAPVRNSDHDPYDFTVHTGPGHLRMPALGIINERFVSYLRASLSAVTRTSVDVSLSTTDSVKFGEFCRSLLLPASLNIFKIEPLRGYALLIFEGPLVFSFVDTFFGGRGGSHVKLEGRGFTTIEMKIIHKITQIILKDLQLAWADFYEASMVFDRSEMDPQFAAIVAPSDMVITIHFRVELPHASGNIALCLPYPTLEPIREILQSSFQAGRHEVDHRWRQYLEKKIAEVGVTLRCTLGTADIRGKDLLAMKIGDVLALDRRVDDPMSIQVENVTKYIGFPGASNNKKAVRITAKVTED